MRFSQKTLQFLIGFLENSEFFEVIKSTPQFREFIVSIQTLPIEKKKKIADELNKRHGIVVDPDKLHEFAVHEKNSVLIMKIIADGAIK